MKTKNLPPWYFWLYFAACLAAPLHCLRAHATMNSGDKIAKTITRTLSQNVFHPEFFRRGTFGWTVTQAQAKMVARQLQMMSWTVRLPVCAGSSRPKTVTGVATSRSVVDGIIGSFDARSNTAPRNMIMSSMAGDRRSREGILQG